MRALRPEPGPTVALIQGNVPQDLKDTPTLEKGLEVLERHVALTRKAAGSFAAGQGRAAGTQKSGERPALVIWPETIFPAPMNWAYDQEFISRLAASPKQSAREYASYLTQCREGLIEAARAADTYLLVGAETCLESDRRYNSAWLISPQGDPVGQYDKIHLVVFGEYTPLTDVFPFLKVLRPEVMGPDLTPGHLPPQLFNLPAPGGTLTNPPSESGTKFGVTICYEDSEAGLFRQSVEEGAAFMVNITNDGWFRDSVELKEHLALCAFRAVENRVPIARCANTGISALIAPDGRIASRVPRESEQTLTGALSMTSLKGFYTRHGDVFAWFCAAGCVGLVLAGFHRKAASVNEQPRGDEVKRQRQGQRNEGREHPA
jgi:apolipoprotein N-acyltransferase